MTIRFERDGAIGNIVLANPPFNRLDLRFAEALRAAVHQVSVSDIRVLLIRSEGPHFSFGGEVRVAGMTVRSDDLIHADRHGAIVIPLDIAAKLPDAADLCGRRETPILEIARSPTFTLEKLKQALARSAEIH